MKAIEWRHFLRLPALSRLVLMAWVGVLLAVPDARANVIAVHNWDSGPEPWTSEYGDVVLTTQPSGGNPGGYLQIAFPETSEPEVLESGWVDIIHVNKNDFFAGNWNGGMGIKFDFFASNQIPQALQLQFHATNSNVWGYSVTDQITQTQTWQTVSVGLGYAAGWGPLPGYDDTEDQFLADLSAIDWIGIYIFREQEGVEVYGLDNFRLLVPEPSQLALLGAVLAGALFGRKRKPRADGAGDQTPVG